MLDKLINVFDDIAKGGRMQELAQVAEEYGIEYQKRADFGRQVTELKAFKVFAKKGAKRFIGVLSEDTKLFNGKIRFYDYLNTKDLETRTSSVLEVYCDDIFTDYVKIEPKSTFSKMKGFFVSEILQFPELNDFNQNFQISTRVEGGALWLKERALTLMTNFPGLTMEAEGNYFLFYRRKKPMKVHKIISNLEFAEEFVHLNCFDHSSDFV